MVGPMKVKKSTRLGIQSTEPCSFGWKLCYSMATWSHKDCETCVNLSGLRYVRWNGLYNLLVWQRTLGLNSNAVHIVIPTTNKNPATNHHWWREYLSLELQPCKFCWSMHPPCGIPADFKQVDASRAGTNADQPGK